MKKITSKEASPELRARIKQEFGDNVKIKVKEVKGTITVITKEGNEIYLAQAFKNANIDIQDKEVWDAINLAFNGKAHTSTKLNQILNGGKLKLTKSIK